MKNVHLLPTDKPSRLSILSSGKLNFGAEIMSSSNSKLQHIYITSPDEEYLEGDWCIDKHNVVYKQETAFQIEFLPRWRKYLRKGHKIFADFTGSKKVILTTDQDLINDGVQPIDDEFLERYIKNPSCEFVEVKKCYLGSKCLRCGFIENHDEVDTEDCPKCHNRDYEHLYNNKIIIPQEELKQEYVKCTCANSLEYSNCGKKCERILDEQEPKQETIQQFIEKHGITEQQLIDGYKQGLDLIFENASKIDKQETLEEAANDFYPIKTEDLICSPKLVRDAFITGANWQAERMYNEEEVIDFLQEMNDWPTTFEGRIDIREWFEQYKKK